MTRPVAIDARYVRPPLSGIGRYTLNLLRGVAAADPGRRFFVLTNDPAGLPSDVQACASFDWVKVKGSPHSPVDQVRVLPALRRIKPGLLHVTEPFVPFLAPCPTVVSVLDLIPITCRHMLHSSVKGRWWRVWRMWLQWQCRKADRIIVCSRHSGADVEQVLKADPRKLRLVPCCIQSPDAPPAAGPREPCVLYVGRRDPYKNVAGLVTAFAKVRQQVPQAQLVIVGATDPRYREAEIESARLGLDQSVLFTGHLPEDQLTAWYAKAAVFAFPSLYEGFGLPPLEAMAMGTPVVASNRTSVPEAVGDAALLVDPADTVAMAEAIVRLIRDPALAERLRQAGFARVRQFGLREHGEMTLRVYDELLGEAR